jgi:hypothetical protein
VSDILDSSSCDPGNERQEGRKQEAEFGSWFIVLEAGMEARSWMPEAGKTVFYYSLYPGSSIQDRFSLLQVSSLQSRFFTILESRLTIND